MATTTSFMGLIAWDLGTDPYDHSQLANNMVAIDAHDHTSGKGKQIPSGGLATNAVTTAKITDANVTTAKLADGSVTTAKLATGAITSAQILDGTITGADILDGTITNAELDPSINPIGHVIMWYRASGSVSPPSGYEILDGRAWSTVTNKLGPGGTQWNTGNMPDMRNKFPLGAALTGTGSGVAQPPDIGQAGGSMTNNLAHTHTVNAHSHTVASHTHSVATQAPHKHKFFTLTWDVNDVPNGTTVTDGHQRTTALPTASGSRQSFYVPDLNRNGYYGDDINAPMSTEVYMDGTSAGANELGSQPAHNHGGVTGAASPSTSSDGTSTGSSLSSTTDQRNAHVGFLFLIRVI